MWENFGLPEIASEYAQQHDYLYWTIMAISVFGSVLVFGLLIYFSARYRRRKADEHTPRILGSHRLELFWTVVPLGIFLAIFVWGVYLYDTRFRIPKDAPEIFVVGKKWMWKVQYEGGQRDINQLHLRVGQSVKVTIRSEDVIHDLGIPAFRFKMDAVPGRTVSSWFKPTKVGTYHLFCDQYCGQGHSNMVGQVIVMNDKDYETWLREGADESLAMQGRKLFLKLNCLSCHSGGNNAKAPVLANLYGSRVALNDGSEVVADDAYIRESIRYPYEKVHRGWKPIMPTYGGQVSEEDLTKLIAYIRSMHKTGMEPRRTENWPAPAGSRLALPPSEADKAPRDGGAPKDKKEKKG